MKKYSLAVTSRTVIGKKVKKLRKEGILPANIYGKDIASTSVQLPLKIFQETYKQAGETGLVELQLEGKTRPALIHNVQLDYITQEPVHADFYQVNLKEKIKTTVPIILIGEPAAVSEKLGMLLQIVSEVEVEALPTDLPEKFELDVTKLAQVGDQLTVADLKTSAHVVVTNDKDQVLAKINELVSQEAIEQAKAEEAAAAEAKTAEGAEAPAEGETKTQETKPEQTPEAPKEEKKE